MYGDVYSFWVYGDVYSEYKNGVSNCMRKIKQCNFFSLSGYVCCFSSSELMAMFAFDPAIYCQKQFDIIDYVTFH